MPPAASLLKFMAAVVSLALMSPPSYSADLLSVVTDPVGLSRSSKELSDSLNRTMLQLQALEQNTNYDVAARLEQIRSIIREATSGAIAGAEAAMLTLEAKVDTDAVDLLYRAQCAAEVALMDQMHRAFVQFLNDLRQADPSINILGIKIVTDALNPITITDPDKAYISSRDAALAALDKNVKDDTNAYDILSTYQNVERNAKFVRCYYIGQGLETRWVKEVNDLERLSAPWISVVEPTT
jgi:hypothetical protein